MIFYTKWFYSIIWFLPSLYLTSFKSEVIFCSTSLQGPTTNQPRTLLMFFNCVYYLFNFVFLRPSLNDRLSTRFEDCVLQPYFLTI